MSTQKKLTIIDFLFETPSEYKEFVSQSHDLLIVNGYKPKFQLKRHGLSAQYNSPDTKGNALQFVINNHVLSMYLYNVFLYEFDGHLENLPSIIIKQYDEYRNCTDSCNPVCSAPMRFNYVINGKQYRKCVSGRQLFIVDKEIVTGILSVLHK